MRVALEVWSSDYSQVEATCLFAESLGIDAFYYGESPNELNLDCWTTLAALARATQRIRLGPVITNVLPGYRSSLLLARQAATVDEISGGRVDMRTGVGAAATFGRRWWEPHGIDYPGYDERLADLRAALERLPDLPITLAAKGERAMRLAVAQADVWETSFCTPREFAEERDRMADFGADDSLGRSLEIDGFLARSDAGVAELLELVRSERGSAEDLDAVFERALVGTPDRVADRLRGLRSVGVDQVVVALHDPHDREAVEALVLARSLSNDT